MNKKTPKVFTYSSEYQNIEQMVLAKPEIETGGDLFGLWLNESTVVLQIIGGPGRNCRRTIHSFFQDVEYLSRTGNQLTHGEGLCNVGEWHSHHRLGLPRPSAGDQETVWGNMPKLGLLRFVLLIANITGSTKSPVVNIGAFLFDWATRKMIEADIVKLDGSSPFRNDPLVMEVLESGKEPENGDHGVRRGSAVTNSANERQRGIAKVEDGGENAPEKLSKKQRKRIRQKKNKKARNQNDQPLIHPQDENLKSSEKIPKGANDSFGSISSQSKITKTALQEVKCNDVGTQTQEQSEQLLSNKQKKKAKGGKNTETTKKNSTPCKKTLTHASQILEFIGQLCEDLDDPKFILDKDSLFNLNFQITPENGTPGVTVSISKSSTTTESNGLPEITLDTKEGTVREQVSSWPASAEETRKSVRSLKKKLVDLEKVRNTTSNSMWQRFTVGIWKTIQARVIPSNCVIL